MCYIGATFELRTEKYGRSRIGYYTQRDGFTMA